MNILRVVKRSPSAVVALKDLNPSVFRYYLNTIEIQNTAVRDGLKPAFLGMLDELLRPDEDNPDIDGNWSFTDPKNAQIVIGGTSTLINIYTGVGYIYRQTYQSIVSPGIPATLGTYAGLLFKVSIDSVTGASTYEQTTNLNLVTHGELIQDGQINQYVLLTALGGTPRILPTFVSVGAGYGVLQSSEQATHGVDEIGVYRPLSYWDRTVNATEAAGNAEYYGILRESISGFILDTSRIMFSTTRDGEALRRYNPIDLVTYAALIKLHYNYRQNSTIEAEI